MISGQFPEPEPIKLGTVAHCIRTDRDGHSTVGCENPVKRCENIFVRQRNRSQQAAPWKVDVDLGSDTVELAWKVFDRGLNEHRVRQAALRRLSRDLYRRFFKRFAIGVDADEELLWIRLSPCRHKPAVARTDIEDDGVVRSRN